MRQDLRSILPIAMKQHGDIEALFDEVPITGFLIAAIAQVAFMLQHLEFAIRRQRFQANSQFVSGILAGIVKDHDFFDISKDTRRNSLQDFSQSGDSVIGNYKYTDTLAAIWGKAVGKRIAGFC